MNNDHKDIKPFIWPVITTGFIAALFLHTFGKIFLNSGDHGRDLYNFLLTSQGQIPFIDYHWVYGPLMPFYYAFLFKILSPSIITALFGWYLLFAFTLTAFYLVCKKLFNSMFASILTILFVVIHSFYFHTFNHIAGTLFSIVVIYFFINYITDNKSKFLWLCSIFLVILGLIKFNIMISILIPCIILLIIIDNKKIIPFLLTSLLPICLIYLAFILILPGHNLYDIFPYQSDQVTHSDKDLIASLFTPIYIAPNILEIKNSFIRLQYPAIYSVINYFLILLVSILILPFLKDNKKRFYTVLFLILFSIFISHEYIILRMDYSLKIWMLPTVLILLAFLAELAIEKLKSPYTGKILLVIGIYLVSWGLLLNYFIYQDNFIKLNISQANVLVYPPSKAILYASVTNFIKKHTTSADKLLAIPYNNLYLFLSNRKSASKYTEFLYQTNLNEDQQKEIIKDLKHNKPPFILISNMVSENSLGTGVFGKTHAILLARYINNNYYSIGIFPEFLDNKKNLAYGEVITILARIEN